MEGLLASAVLKLAAAKLASAIGDQVMMQWKLEDNLEDMKDALESMAAVLKDAERRSIRDKSVLLWLKQLKNAAYDIYDMLDDFQDGKRTGLVLYVSTAAKNIVLTIRMKKMKRQLRNIKEEGEQFKLLPDYFGTIEQQIIDPRETISVENEEDVVVGREEEKKYIIELLLERNSTEETIIVPIYGLGGIGKTTLARLVFNDTHFEEYDHRVWVYVSQVLNLKKIGNNIISRVSEQESHDLNDLQPIYQQLKELLHGKKCLIVLDDLWEEKDTELETLKTMLINVGKAGSKIDVIVTTRKEEIAQNIRTGKSYNLKPLDDTMCWSIIKKRCNFESRPDKEQLEQIGQDIANKCAGIALAAQALGFMLSSIVNLEEWSAIRNSDIWNESSSAVFFPLPSLMLSYESMPSYLKLCFSYCAIFPKGHNIGKYDLIHQWIALDFIEPYETFSAIQIGEKYVRQLLGMSFLHHSDLSSSSRRLAVFTMHDLVHDLARSVMADELLVSDAEEGSNSSQNKYCRCAFLTNYSEPTKLSAILPANVRALRFLDCQLRNNAFIFAKYLRVLDLSRSPFSKLPKCVTQLPRLQYLNISWCNNLEKLPEDIGILTKLQYLNLHGSDQISALPESIGKIERLMHLDLTGCSRLVELPESLGNLKSLVHLELSGCSRVVVMPKAFCGLTKLQYLNFSWCSNLEKLPEDIGSLTKLQYLNLSYCGVKEIPGALGGLTKLQYLNLSGILDESSTCVECISALTNIEHLDLSWNRGLNYLPESLGNLKRLHTLDISWCSGLDSIPESIGAIRTLKFIEVSNCSNQLKVHMTHSPLLSKFVQLASFMVASPHPYPPSVGTQPL